MNQKQILHSLNWFLLLEKEQVKLYGSQSKATDDYKLSKYLNRFKEIEQDHVNVLTKLIKDLGGEPSPYMEYSGIIIGEAVKLGGNIVASYTDIKKYLRINIIGEQMAIKDYKRFITSVNDPSIEKILWQHLIDEDLHLKWMQNRIKDLSAEG